MHMTRVQFAALSLTALLFLAACSSAPKPPPALDAAQALKELAEVYKYLDYSKLPPPKAATDFNQYQDAMMTAYQGVQNGDYVVLFGVGLASSPPASNQILAYEKRAASDGGAVLFRDGTVKQMTAAEFNAAPKAK
jgi:hypothetical protein